MENNRLDGMSMNIEQAEMEKLKEVFPQCFSEGKLDIDKLLSLCGEYIDNDFEKYKFEWKGKIEALKLAQKRSTGTLRPCKAESVNFDETKNLYIEGDNLEVLKLLQTAYYNKIKMIYIDPPYNTGKDFVYEDDFADPMARYKEVTQQTTKSNAETMGRYHTNWLNMMYPRLRLAYNLLSEDGVIFISIDDNEVTNLRKLCDEVFGEENFIGQIIHKNNSMKNQSKYLGVSTEYILVYSKNTQALNEKQGSWRASKKGAADINAMFKKLKEQGLSCEEIRENIMEMYSRPKYAHLSRWNKVDEKGVFKDADLSRNNGPKDYTIINPNTGKPCMIPNRGWGKSHEELLRLQKEDLIWYGDENTAPGMKSYLTEDSESVFDNFIFADTAADKKYIDKLFGSQVFEFPKSLDMIKQIIALCTNKDDLVVDFFSGSATTAHAVMQLNAEDGGNRRFIMVQLPELTEEKSEAFKAGYTNICEIGKERIRRAGKKILEDNAQTELGEEDKKPLDVGFKVFKLDTSNLKTWDGTPIQDKQIDLFYERLNAMIDTVKDDRTDMDVVYEVMLKMGIPLDVEVQYMEINDKIAYIVGDFILMICLADKITAEDIEAMAQYAPAKIICAEAGFADDSALSNAHYILKDRAIELKLV